MSHVEVDHQVLRRRVGHKRRRIPLADVTATRIERSGGRYRLDRLAVRLVDGSEYPVTTRRSRELAASIKLWRASVSP